MYSQLDKCYFFQTRPFYALTASPSWRHQPAVPDSAHRSVAPNTLVLTLTGAILGAAMRLLTAVRRIHWVCFGICMTSYCSKYSANTICSTNIMKPLGIFRSLTMRAFDSTRLRNGRDGSILVRWYI